VRRSVGVRGQMTPENDRKELLLKLVFFPEDVVDHAQCTRPICPLVWGGANTQKQCLPGRGGHALSLAA
jgi:hypothetical protein